MTSAHALTKSQNTGNASGKDTSDFYKKHLWNKILWADVNFMKLWRQK